MKILLIAFYFPPNGGGGVQRILKFAKYLPEFGVEPVVIAALEAGYPVDESLLDDLPQEIKVHRIRHTSFLYRADRLMQALRNRKDKNNKEMAIPKRNIESSWRDRVLNIYNSLQFPDDKSAWRRKAVKKGAMLIEQGGFDIIMSTAPPISSHFVADKLKRKYQIPWVADYRDLWVGNPSNNLPRWRTYLERFLEKKLVSNVDGVTAATQEIANHVYSVSNKNKKVIYLPNGYDEADFSSVVPDRKKEDYFFLVYTGSLYGHRTPVTLLAGVRLLFERYPCLARRLRLRFFGNIGSRFENVFADFERDYPDVVERFSYIPHKLIPKTLLEADALLLVIGGGENARGVLTGKIFEYLRAARPILMLGSKYGEAAKIIQQNKRGVILDEDDTHGVADILKKWLENGVELEVQSESEDHIRIYERRETTKRLVEFLREVHEASRL